MVTQSKILTYFEMIPDSRKCRITRSLVEIIAIIVLSTLCGPESREDMTNFGESRKEWLSTFLQLPRGIPCPVTLKRVLSFIDPSAFLEAFLEWTRSISEIIPKMVSIDGKTLRSTLVDEKSLHILTTWCNLNQLILGQLRTASKSNEIKTIPEPIKQLTLPAGFIITIDGAGTQKEIASQIRTIRADYILALRENQELFETIRRIFLSKRSKQSKSISLLNKMNEAKRGMVE